MKLNPGSSHRLSWPCAIRVSMTLQLYEVGVPDVPLPWPRCAGFLLFLWPLPSSHKFPPPWVSQSLLTYNLSLQASSPLRQGSGLAGWARGEAGGSGLRCDGEDASDPKLPSSLCHGLGSLDCVLRAVTNPVWPTGVLGCCPQTGPLCPGLKFPRACSFLAWAQASAAHQPLQHVHIHTPTCLT